MNETPRDEFAAGYLIAVANIVHLYDEPNIAADVLEELGRDVDVLDGLGLTEYDEEPLRELFAELDRRAVSRVGGLMDALIATAKQERAK